MSQKTLNGILLVNKDKDGTSHQIVQDVRQILKQKAVGHAGTLDPTARGLMVILCGMATKLSSFFLNDDKRYTLEIKFGLETSSFDLQGDVLKSQEVSLPEKDIKELLENTIGDLELPVPIFSAVKVKGRRLYSYAYAGEEIQTPLKKMSFWDLDIHKIKKDGAELSVSCSKGSYIRSWVHHLGQKIKTGACLVKLERILSGSFDIQHSLTIKELREKLENKIVKTEEDLKTLLGNSFLSPPSALKQFPEMELTLRNARILKQGKVPVYILQSSQKDQISVNKKGQSQILKAVKGQKLLALLEMRPFEKMRILKNFPNQDF